MMDVKKLQTLYRDHCEVRPVRAQLPTRQCWCREMSLIIITTRDWKKVQRGFVEAENDEGFFYIKVYGKKIRRQKKDKINRKIQMEIELLGANLI